MYSLKSLSLVKEFTTRGVDGNNNNNNYNIYCRDVPVDYKYSTPIIRLNNDGHVRYSISALHVLIIAQIIAINWGPQIQSPLMINEVLMMM
jgi:hypothetical protein